ncbi:hypothetical protein [Curtobacterium sp. PhB136]|uniref:hypothetical protein n=1 Tax=Curtobacterium sp. PhB136 TaxID=2485181 RepID=UPI001045085F|nr:hypothetical protein [Curtobacterium sp. PhB136]TCK62818.1 hypothetical protein EDF27_2475 [Curtobacterium sp. PhB136]
MDTITLQSHWTGPDTGPFATWVADRAAADQTHCVRIDAVGRDPAGRLAVRTEALHGARLPDALDRIGSPTVGVAVTLTVPLLLLAADARSGAVVLGDARADDVLVDDAGVTVLADHPPGADPPGTDLPSTDLPSTDLPGADSPGTDLPGTDLPVIDPPGTDLPATDWNRTDVPGLARSPSVTGPPPGERPSGVGRAGRAAVPARTSESPGPTALLHAVRAVWERVDPREPCRAVVDTAVAEALGGGVDEVLRLLDVVRATAPPRPVRWDPPPDDFLFVDTVDDAPDDTGVVRWVRRFVERGLTLPGGRTVPARRVVVGGVVAGLAAAGVITLGAPP